MPSFFIKHLLSVHWPLVFFCLQSSARKRCASGSTASWKHVLRQLNSIWRQGRARVLPLCKQYPYGAVCFQHSSCCCCPVLGESGLCSEVMNCSAQLTWDGAAWLQAWDCSLSLSLFFIALPVLLLFQVILFNKQLANYFLSS